MPIDKEILKKVELIRIMTRQRVTSVFAGEFESAFKGEGLEFEEVREYQPGDEIRTIDWNVTARTGYPHIKRYREEREQSIYFLVDVSPSGEFGSGGRTRSELAAEIVSVLSFSASNNNDRTGLLLFSDKPELFIPPGKGMTHTMHMVREMLTHKPEGHRTSVSAALDYLGQVAHRRSIVFILSDFYDPGFHRQLSISARRHEIVCLYLYDPAEKSLPDGGLVSFTDSETGRSTLLDTSSRRVRTEYERRFYERLDMLRSTFSRYGCDFLDIDISEEYIRSLSEFFIRREKRR
ncbi:MAG: DUF58 domain-containing protein [Spirochaetales bacterium]|uniref:DUF58 domain-containing protein n=1 Tax=Candidatus Thalassospirochaeta sargassi TaxID=3119039 RepID=A0AAJ1IDK4_9SPIO|nr:DUF58 domain-containing protein [Spirochaetales bacterium]